MGLPTKLIAGDSATWTKPATDAAEILTYSFRDAEGSGLNVLGVNDGTDHTFTLGQGESSQLEAGWYDTFTIEEDGAGARETVKVSRLHVLPDPQSTPEKTHSARMVEFLESALEQRATGGLIETRSEGGLDVGKMATAEIETLLTRYRNKLINERRSGAVKRGQNGGGVIGIQF